MAQGMETRFDKHRPAESYFRWLHKKYLLPKKGSVRLIRQPRKFNLAIDSEGSFSGCRIIAAAESVIRGRASGRRGTGWEMPERLRAAKRQDHSSVAEERQDIPRLRSYPTRHFRVRGLHFAFPANLRVFCLPLYPVPVTFGRALGESDLSDRKYSSPGYQDRREESQRSKPAPRPSADMTYGPRALNMAPSRTVSRCAPCGTLLPATVDLSGNCPKCGAALHACKQCTNFDPGSRFECRLVLPGFSKKDLKNDCQSFSLRTSVEKETSVATTRADDARRAFENLFKK